MSSGFVGGVTLWVQDFHFGNTFTKYLDDLLGEFRRHPLDATLNAGHVPGVQVDRRS